MEGKETTTIHLEYRRCSRQGAQYHVLVFWCKTPTAEHHEQLLRNSFSCQVSKKTLNWIARDLVDSVHLIMRQCHLASSRKCNPSTISTNVSFDRPSHKGIRNRRALGVRTSTYIFDRRWWFGFGMTHVVRCFFRNQLWRLHEDILEVPRQDRLVLVYTNSILYAHNRGGKSSAHNWLVWMKFGIGWPHLLVLFCRYITWLVSSPFTASPVVGFR